MKIIANGFTTIVPDGWDDRTMTTLVGSVGASGFAANIVVTRERVDARMSVEDYAAGQREAMLAEIPELEILDERPTSISGAPAFQRLQRFTIEGEQLQQAQTFVLANGIIFVITMTTTIADFDKQIPALRSVTDNLRFFDSEAAQIP